MKGRRLGPKKGSKKQNLTITGESYRVEFSSIMGKRLTILIGAFPWHKTFG